MRVFHAKALIDVVEGREEWLNVSGRLAQEISSRTEVALKELPKEITKRFNTFEGTPEQVIDYSSEPIILMPDEFRFNISVEHLGRLARELLIRMLPLDVAAWEPTAKPVADLWIGGEDEVLNRDERNLLIEATRETWALPVRGKVFVLGKDIDDPNRRAIRADGIRHAGGIVQDEVSPFCNYFVTNDSEQAQLARAAGAKRVIDTLTQQVMISRE